VKLPYLDFAFSLSMWRLGVYVRFTPLSWSWSWPRWQHGYSGSFRMGPLDVDLYVWDHGSE
jgi:hypothetical protein